MKHYDENRPNLSKEICDKLDDPIYRLNVAFRQISTAKANLEGAELNVKVTLDLLEKEKSDAL